MMINRYKKAKRRTPSHMTEGMTECLESMFLVIEGFAQVQGQWDGTAHASGSQLGSVRPGTVRSAREDITQMAEECNIFHGDNVEAVLALISLFRRIETDYPDGQKVPSARMQELWPTFSLLTRDFLNATIAIGEEEPENLIWGTG